MVVLVFDCDWLLVVVLFWCLVARLCGLGLRCFDFLVLCGLGRCSCRRFCWSGCFLRVFGLLLVFDLLAVCWFRRLVGLLLLVAFGLFVDVWCFGLFVAFFVVCLGLLLFWFDVVRFCCW